MTSQSSFSQAAKELVEDFKRAYQDNIERIIDGEEFIIGSSISETSFAKRLKILEGNYYLDAIEKYNRIHQAARQGQQPYKEAYRAIAIIMEDIATIMHNFYHIPTTSTRCGKSISESEFTLKRTEIANDRTGLSLFSTLEINELPATTNRWNKFKLYVKKEVDYANNLDPKNDERQELFHQRNTRAAKKGDINKTAIFKRVFSKLLCDLELIQGLTSAKTLQKSYERNIGTFP